MSDGRKNAEDLKKALNKKRESKDGNISVSKPSPLLTSDSKNKKADDLKSKLNTRDKRAETDRGKYEGENDIKLTNQQIFDYSKGANRNSELNAYELARKNKTAPYLRTEKDILDDKNILNKLGYNDKAIEDARSKGIGLRDEINAFKIDKQEELFLSDFGLDKRQLSEKGVNIDLALKHPQLTLNALKTLSLDNIDDVQQINKSLEAQENRNFLQKITDGIKTPNLISQSGQFHQKKDNWENFGMAMTRSVNQNIGGMLKFGQSVFGTDGTIADKFMDNSREYQDLDRPEWTGTETIGDARWLSNLGGEQIPNIVSFVAGGGLAGAGAKFLARSMNASEYVQNLSKVLGATIPTALSEASIEAGHTYEEALRVYGNSEKASEIANQVFAQNSALLLATNGLQFKTLFAPPNLRGKIAGQNTIRNYANVGASEGLQEYTQEFISTNALYPEVTAKDYISNRKNDEAFWAGAISGAGTKAFSDTTQFATDVVKENKIGKMVDARNQRILENKFVKETNPDVIIQNINNNSSYAISGTDDFSYGILELSELAQHKNKEISEQASKRIMNLGYQLQQMAQTNPEQLQENIAILTEKLNTEPLGEQEQAKIEANISFLKNFVKPDFRTSQYDMNEENIKNQMFDIVSNDNRLNADEKRFANQRIDTLVTQLLPLKSDLDALVKNPSKLSSPNELTTIKPSTSTDLVLNNANELQPTKKPLENLLNTLKSPTLNNSSDKRPLNQSITNTLSLLEKSNVISKKNTEEINLVLSNPETKQMLINQLEHRLSVINASENTLQTAQKRKEYAETSLAVKKNNDKMNTLVTIGQNIYNDRQQGLSFSLNQYAKKPNEQSKNELLEHINDLYKGLYNDKDGLDKYKADFKTAYDDISSTEQLLREQIDDAYSNTYIQQGSAVNELESNLESLLGNKLNALQKFNEFYNIPLEIAKTGKFNSKTLEKFKKDIANQFEGTILDFFEGKRLTNRELENNRENFLNFINKLFSSKGRTEFDLNEILTLLFRNDIPPTIQTYKSSFNFGEITIDELNAFAEENTPYKNYMAFQINNDETKLALIPLPNNDIFYWVWLNYLKFNRDKSMIEAKHSNISTDISKDNKYQEALYGISRIENHPEFKGILASKYYVYLFGNEIKAEQEYIKKYGEGINFAVRESEDSIPETNPRDDYYTQKQEGFRQQTELNELIKQGKQNTLKPLIRPEKTESISRLKNVLLERKSELDKQETEWLENEYKKEEQEKATKEAKEEQEKATKEAIKQRLFKPFNDADFTETKDALKQSLEMFDLFNLIDDAKDEDDVNFLPLLLQKQRVELKEQIFKNQLSGLNNQLTQANDKLKFINEIILNLNKNHLEYLEQVEKLEEKIENQNTLEADKREYKDSLEGLLGRERNGVVTLKGEIPKLIEDIKELTEQTKPLIKDTKNLKEEIKKADSFYKLYTDYHKKYDEKIIEIDNDLAQSNSFFTNYRTFDVEKLRNKLKEAFYNILYKEDTEAIIDNYKNKDLKGIFDLYNKNLSDLDKNLTQDFGKDKPFEKYVEKDVFDSFMDKLSNSELKAEDLEEDLTEIDGLLNDLALKKIDIYNENLIQKFNSTNINKLSERISDFEKSMDKLSIEYRQIVDIAIKNQQEEIARAEALRVQQEKEKQERLAEEQKQAEELKAKEQAVGFEEYQNNIFNGELMDKDKLLEDKNNLVTKATNVINSMNTRFINRISYMGEANEKLLLTEEVQPFELRLFDINTTFFKLINLNPTQLKDLNKPTLNESKRLEPYGDTMFEALDIIQDTITLISKDLAELNFDTTGKPTDSDGKILPRRSRIHYHDNSFFRNEAKPENAKDFLIDLVANIFMGRDLSKFHDKTFFNPSHTDTPSLFVEKGSYDLYDFELYTYVVINPRILDNVEYSFFNNLEPYRERLNNEINKTAFRLSAIIHDEKNTKYKDELMSLIESLIEKLETIFDTGVDITLSDFELGIKNPKDVGKIPSLRTKIDDLVSKNKNSIGRFSSVIKSGSNVDSNDLSMYKDFLEDYIERITDFKGNIGDIIDVYPTLDTSIKPFPIEDLLKAFYIDVTIEILSKIAKRPPVKTINSPRPPTPSPSTPSTPSTPSPSTPSTPSTLPTASTPPTSAPSTTNNNNLSDSLAFASSNEGYYELPTKESLNMYEVINIFLLNNKSELFNKWKNPTLKDFLKSLRYNLHIHKNVLVKDLPDADIDNPMKRTKEYALKKLSDSINNPFLTLVEKLDIDDMKKYFQDVAKNFKPTNSSVGTKSKENLSEAMTGIYHFTLDIKSKLGKQSNPPTTPTVTTQQNQTNNTKPKDDIKKKNDEVISEENKSTEENEIEQATEKEAPVQDTPSNSVESSTTPVYDDEGTPLPIEVKMHDEIKKIITATLKSAKFSGDLVKFLKNKYQNLTTKKIESEKANKYFEDETIALLNSFIFPNGVDTDNRGKPRDIYHARPIMSDSQTYKFYAGTTMQDENSEMQFIRDYNGINSKNLSGDIISFASFYDGIITNAFNYYTVSARSNRSKHEYLRWLSSFKQKKLSFEAKSFKHSLNVARKSALKKNSNFTDTELHNEIKQWITSDHKKDNSYNSPRKPTPMIAEVVDDLSNFNPENIQEELKSFTKKHFLQRFSAESLDISNLVKINDREYLELTAIIPHNQTENGVTPVFVESAVVNLVRLLSLQKPNESKFYLNLIRKDDNFYYTVDELDIFDYEGKDYPFTSNPKELGRRTNIRLKQLENTISAYEKFTSDNHNVIFAGRGFTLKKKFPFIPETLKAQSIKGVTLESIYVNNKPLISEIQESLKPNSKEKPTKEKQETENVLFRVPRRKDKQSMPFYSVMMDVLGKKTFAVNDINQLFVQSVNVAQKLEQHDGIAYPAKKTINIHTSGTNTDSIFSLNLFFKKKHLDSYKFKIDGIPDREFVLSYDNEFVYIFELVGDEAVALNIKLNGTNYVLAMKLPEIIKDGNAYLSEDFISKKHENMSYLDYPTIDDAFEAGMSLLLDTWEGLYSKVFVTDNKGKSTRFKAESLKKLGGEYTSALIEIFKKIITHYNNDLPSNLTHNNRVRLKIDTPQEFEFNIRLLMAIDHIKRFLNDESNRSLLVKQYGDDDVADSTISSYTKALSTTRKFLEGEAFSNFEDRHHFKKIFNIEDDDQLNERIYKSFMKTVDKTHDYDLGIIVNFPERNIQNKDLMNDLGSFVKIIKNLEKDVEALKKAFPNIYYKDLKEAFENIKPFLNRIMKYMASIVAVLTTGYQAFTNDFSFNGVETAEHIAMMGAMFPFFSKKNIQKEKLNPTEKSDLALTLMPKPKSSFLNFLQAGSKIVDDFKTVYKGLNNSDFANLTLQLNQLKTLHQNASHHRNDIIATILRPQLIGQKPNDNSDEGILNFVEYVFFNEYVVLRDALETYEIASNRLNNLPQTLFNQTIRATLPKEYERKIENADGTVVFEADVEKLKERIKEVEKIIGIEYFSDYGIVVANNQAKKEREFEGQKFLGEKIIQALNQRKLLWDNLRFELIQLGRTVGLDFGILDSYKKMYFPRHILYHMIDFDQLNEQEREALNRNQLNLRELERFLDEGIDDIQSQKGATLQTLIQSFKDSLRKAKDDNSSASLLDDFYQSSVQTRREMSEDAVPKSIYSMYRTLQNRSGTSEKSYVTDYIQAESKSLIKAFQDMTKLSVIHFILNHHNLTHENFGEYDKGFRDKSIYDSASISPKDHEWKNIFVIDYNGKKISYAKVRERLDQLIDSHRLTFTDIYLSIEEIANANFTAKMDTVELNGKDYVYQDKTTDMASFYANGINPFELILFYIDKYGRKNGIEYLFEFLYSQINKREHEIAKIGSLIKEAKANGMPTQEYDLFRAEKQALMKPIRDEINKIKADSKMLKAIIKEVVERYEAPPVTNEEREVILKTYELTALDIYKNLFDLAIFKEFVVQNVSAEELVVTEGGETEGENSQVIKHIKIAGHNAPFSTTRLRELQIVNKDGSVIPYVLANNLMRNTKAINRINMPLNQLISLDAPYIPLKVQDAIGRRLQTLKINRVRDMQQRYKGWIILNPLNIVGYIARNITGDFERAFVERGLAKYVEKCQQVLYAFIYHNLKVTQNDDRKILTFNKANRTQIVKNSEEGKEILRIINELGHVINMGGLYTTSIAHDHSFYNSSIYDILKRELGVNYKGKIDENTIKNMLESLTNGYTTNVRKSIDWTSMIPKFSMYLIILDMIRKNNGKVLDYYASDEDVVNALKPTPNSEVDINQMRAWQLANDIFLNYSNVSENGETLADSFFGMPFFRFREMIIKTTYHLIKNHYKKVKTILNDLGLSKSQKVKEIFKTIIKSVIQLTAFRFLIKLIAKLSLASTMLFGVMQTEEFKKEDFTEVALEQVQDAFQLIDAQQTLNFQVTLPLSLIGKQTGKLHESLEFDDVSYSFKQIGMYDDILSVFGVADYNRDLDVINRSIADENIGAFEGISYVALENVWEALNYQLQSFNPALKGIIELALDEKLYPNIRDTQDYYSALEPIMSAGGLGRAYPLLDETKQTVNFTGINDDDYLGMVSRGLATLARTFALGDIKSTDMHRIDLIREEITELNKAYNSLMNKQNRFKSEKSNEKWKYRTIIRNTMLNSHDNFNAKTDISDSTYQEIGKAFDELVRIEGEEAFKSNKKKPTQTINNIESSFRSVFDFVEHYYMNSLNGLVGKEKADSKNLKEFDKQLSSRFIMNISKNEQARDIENGEASDIETAKATIKHYVELSQYYNRKLGLRPFKAEEYDNLSAKPKDYMFEEIIMKWIEHQTSKNSNYYKELANQSKNNVTKEQVDLYNSLSEQ